MRNSPETPVYNSTTLQASKQKKDARRDALHARIADKLEQLFPQTNPRVCRPREEAKKRRRQVPPSQRPQNSTRTKPLLEMSFPRRVLRRLLEGAACYKASTRPSSRGTSHTPRGPGVYTSVFFFFFQKNEPVLSETHAYAARVTALQQPFLKSWKNNTSTQRALLGRGGVGTRRVLAATLPGRRRPRLEQRRSHRRGMARRARTPAGAQHDMI